MLRLLPARSPSAAFPAVAARLLLAGLGLAGTAAAQTPPQVQPYATLSLPMSELRRFGTSVEAMGDTDGDGVPDFLVMEQGFGFSSKLTARFSGATLEPIALYRLGSDHDIGPDLSGDGVPDIVTGGPNGDGVNATGTYAAVVNGQNGALLLSLFTYRRTPGDCFGCGVAAIGNAIHGSEPDYVVGASASKTFRPLTGALFVLDGARSDSSLFGPIAPPHTAGVGTTWGYGRHGTLFALGDVDLDGLGDIAVGAPRDRPEADRDLPLGRVYVHSAATGSLLYTLVSPGRGTSEGFGERLFPVPDRTGDGAPEYFVYTISGGPPGTLQPAGRLSLYDGRRGVRLDSLDHPNRNGDDNAEFGVAFAQVPDLDGDGMADYVVGSPGSQVRFDGRSWPLDSGVIYVMSGGTKALLYLLVTPSPSRYGHFGASIASVGDLDGDGRPEIVAGAPGQPDTRNGSGFAYVFNLPTVTPVATDTPASAALLSLDATPHPVRTTSTFRFTLSTSGPVRLTLHDALGRTVAVLADGLRDAGANAVLLDAAAHAPGIYLARLTTAHGRATARVVVAR